MLNQRCMYSVELASSETKTRELTSKKKSVIADCFCKVAL